MDWRLKILGEKAVDVLLPRNLGLPLHYKFQKKFGNVGRSVSAEKLGNQGFGMASYLYEQADFDFVDANILEVGTGWYGADALVFHVLGANEIWTCDQMAHLDGNLMLKLVKGLGSALDTLCQTYHMDVKPIESRYQKLVDCGSLDELLEACNIRYIAPAQLHKLDLPSDHFDLFYSYSVLQRVPPNDLRQYLGNARSAMKTNAYALHVIHHGDHNARLTKSIRNLDYLRYSDAVYDAMQSKLYNYQSRLRHAEMLELFDECGYHFVSEELTSNEVESISGMRLAKRFQHIPVDDLLVTRTQLLSQVNRSVAIQANPHQKAELSSVV